MHVTQISWYMTLHTAFGIIRVVFHNHGRFWERIIRGYSGPPVYNIFTLHNKPAAYMLSVGLSQWKLHCTESCFPLFIARIYT